MTTVIQEVKTEDLIVREELPFSFFRGFFCILWGRGTKMQESGIKTFKIPINTDKIVISVIGRG